MRRNVISISTLKKIIADAPDDVMVVVPAADHSYRAAGVELGTALFSMDHGITEDHGEESTPEAQYGERRPALIIT